VIERLALFGATGDLAGRFLFPALAALLAGGHLPDGFTITGAARQDLDDEAFRRDVHESLAEHAGDVPASARRRLVGSLRYRTVDVADPVRVASVLAGSSGPVAAYLALPPTTFPAAVQALGLAGLGAGSRIVLEKPFGGDLESAVSLNRLLADVLRDERAVFRVDHVLGMATTQSLLALRRNPVLEQAWTGAQVDQVEILWNETLALEGRAGYYDGAGALEDVLQNHMLQLLCLVAMELPRVSDDAKELRRRKVDVLRAARVIGSRRARYAAGTLADGTRVPAYTDEEGGAAARGTETFAEVALELDSERWRGTRFVLRCGKALRRRHKGVVLRFRPNAVAAATELRIGIDGPCDIALGLTIDAFGRPSPLELRGEPPAAELPAYARVLLDVLGGGSALSVASDEAEWAWRVVTPVVEAWREGRVPLEEYPAGSDGPVRHHHERIADSSSA